MDKLIQVLTGLAPIIALLMGSGFLVKYAPFLNKIPNTVIPFLNALITFLAAFGPSPAHAGFFGDLGQALTLPAKIAASAAISAFATLTYEVYGRNAVSLLQKLAQKVAKS